MSEFEFKCPTEEQLDSITEDEWAGIAQLCQFSKEECLAIARLMRANPELANISFGGDADKLIAELSAELDG